MPATVWGALLPGVPFLLAVAGLLLPHRARTAAATLAVGGAAIVLLIAIGLAIGVHQPVDQGVRVVDFGSIAVTFGVRLDGVATMVAIAVGVVALAVQVYSVAYLRDDDRYVPYAAQVSLFTAAMLLVVVSGDLIALLIGWEVMGICSYLLIGHDRRLPEAPRAAVKAFLVTRVADLGAHPRRHHGGCRGLRRRPPLPAVLGRPGRPHRAGRLRRDHDAAWCARRHGAGRHQAGTGMVHREPARLHERSARRRRARRRAVPPADPRGVQGVAVPRRRRGHPRGGRQHVRSHGRAAAWDAGDVLVDDDRLGRPGRRTAAGRLLEQGRHRRGDAGRRGAGTGVAGLAGLPRRGGYHRRHRLVRDAPVAVHLLRRPARAGGRASARTPVGHAWPGGRLGRAQRAARLRRVLARARRPARRRPAAFQR